MNQQLSESPGDKPGFEADKSPSDRGSSPKPAQPIIKPLLPPSERQIPRVNIDLDPEDEAEIESMLAGLDTEALEPVRENEPGEPAQEHLQTQPGLKRGQVIAVRGDDIFVDMGGKSEGVIAAEQFPEGVPQVGSHLDVLIDHFDRSDGLLVLRRPGSVQEADWSTVQTGMVVEGKVTEANKGGLAVDLSGIRAFMPASQIDIVRVENLQSMVGTTVKCMVTEVNRATKNVIVSRRELLEVEREEQQKKTWSELKEGDIRTGRIKSVKPFGAFVDIGGADGLLPIGELSWQRVEDPNELVKPGQQVQVKILRVDRDTRKMSLSLKQLSKSPWETLPERYSIGTVVPGRVTRLMDFGAFVEVEPGIEGLVHISELAHQRVHRVRDVVQEGQPINVQVLSIDPVARRLSLSLRATQEKAAETVAEDEDTEDDRPPVAKPEFPLKGGLDP